MKRIVVGTDFSDASARALFVAIEIAKGSGATIDLLHVHPMPAAGEIWPLPSVAPLPSPLREVLKEVQCRLDELAASVQSALIDCLTFTPQGDVAHEIVEHAEQVGAHMIVIGKDRGSESGSGARRNEFSTRHIVPFSSFRLRLPVHEEPKIRSGAASMACRARRMVRTHACRLCGSYRPSSQRRH